MTFSLCVARDCRADPAGDPGLCPRCTRRLGSDLARIPHLYTGAEQALSPGRQGGIRVSGTAGSTGLALRDGPVEARAAIRVILASWSQLVVDERGVAAPPRTVPDMAAFLLRHAEWLGRHPAAAEFVEEVGELRAAAVRSTRDERTRRVDIGGCVEPGCDGALVALMRARDAVLPTEIRCEADLDHRWAASQWFALSRRLVRS